MKASLWSLLGRLAKDPNARAQLLSEITRWGTSHDNSGHNLEPRGHTPRREIEGPNPSLAPQYAGAFGARVAWFIGGTLLLVWSLLCLLAYWFLSLSGDWLSGHARQVLDSYVPLASIDPAAIAQALAGPGATIAIVVWLGVSAIILGLTILASRLLRGRTPK